MTFVIVVYGRVAPLCREVYKRQATTKARAGALGGPGGLQARWDVRKAGLKEDDRKR